MAKRKNNGFLLIEVLISLVIIAAVLVVINRALSASLRAVRLAGDYLIADYILEDKIFDIKIKDAYSDLKVADTVSSGQREFSYVLKISSPEIISQERQTNLKDLSLREANLGINWGQPGDISRFNVYTYVWQEQNKQL